MTFLTSRPILKTPRTPQPLPERIEGRVTLRNVTFGYDPHVPILKGLNLDIQPGEVVAFVGPSGAGKSTLVNLVPRFYDVTGGQILVDGQNIAEVKVKSLRNAIGMVLQDNILFTGTIKDNILYGRPGATDDEIVEAAVAANAHHFIEALPDGYETEIGERGTKLSGGQKQRLAITRAFLRDPRILILRRSHLGPGQRKRKADPKCAEPFDGRAHHTDYRTSAVNHHARGQNCDDAGRENCRDRQPQ